MLIGEKIRVLRINRGLTQKQLAEEIYERSYISLIERHKIIPTSEAIRLIASRLGATVEELTNDDKKIFDTSMSMYQKGLSGPATLC